MLISDLQTPALLIDAAALAHNVDTMAAIRSGNRLRPHVKAFKSTALARYVADRGGHSSFCCATLKEMEGMTSAGLGQDLLLANETLDADRLATLVAGNGRITVAVDSPQTIEVAAAAGAEVLIDVNVGLPRCGCQPAEAAALADTARSAGLTVRGVMGYEGHLVGNPSRAKRIEGVDASMALLRQALEGVGGGLSSAGGTGTFDLHDWADEVQAGSYLLMDSHYQRLNLPFRQALTVLSTVVSRTSSTTSSPGWAVADVGLKSLGMDHGNPTLDGATVLFCSDEHTTIMPAEDRGDELPRVGDRVQLVPAHVDPTVAYHEWLHVVEGDEVLDSWPVDLRNW